MIIVFGSLSIFSLGGFLVGMALSIASGALAIVAGVSAPSPVHPEGALRACTACGGLYAIGFSYCPYCGRPAIPAAPA